MRSRILSALALLAAAGVAAYAQNEYGGARPGPAPVYDPPRPTPVVQSSPPVVLTSPAQPLVPVGNTPAAQGPVRDVPINVLVGELKAIQAQKAALAKREAEVAAEVRRQLEDYTGTLEKLGLAAPRMPGPAASEPPPGPRVVRPVGGTRGTPDERIPRGRTEMVPYTEPAPAAPRPVTPAPPPGN
ncbi:hypothetical protein J0H58_16760 [bacterium]|nr:hypothetical protein [bacterium]